MGPWQYSRLGGRVGRVVPQAQSRFKVRFGALYAIGPIGFARARRNIMLGK
jgi:hypothetical protein